MQIKPVPGYGKPGYPIRTEVDARPEILRLLPKRWQANPTVVAALTACIALANCGRIVAADTVTTVAPVFKHGDGAGSFGCVAINPPVFLSEDEARKVIVEEAKRAGIEFTRDGRTIAKIEIPTDSKLEPVTQPDGSVKVRAQTRHADSVDRDGRPRREAQYRV